MLLSFTPDWWTSPLGHVSKGARRTQKPPKQRDAHHVWPWRSNTLLTTWKPARCLLLWKPPQIEEGDTRLSSMECRRRIPLHTYVPHGSRQVRGLGGVAPIRACQDGAFCTGYVDHSLITHLKLALLYSCQATSSNAYQQVLKTAARSPACALKL